MRHGWWQVRVVPRGSLNVFHAALAGRRIQQSGWGREMGHEVLNNYTEVKAVTTKL